LIPGIRQFIHNPLNDAIGADATKEFTMHRIIVLRPSQESKETVEERDVTKNFAQDQEKTNYCGDFPYQGNPFERWRADSWRPVFRQMIRQWERLRK
jgi:hypothetical protein